MTGPAAAAGPAPRAPFTIPLQGRDDLVLGPRTLVMGIVNVTPDSFSDGGAHASPEAAAARALHLFDEGADLVDVGGESTRPGAAEVAAAEQIRRVVPVIRAVAAARPGAVVSVDTRSAEVARAAVAAGAAIVNDVSGLVFDPAMPRTVASLGVPAIVMHMRGTPADMRGRAVYADPVGDVVAELAVMLAAATAAGVRHVIADPGLGFAKTAEQSLAILASLPRLAALGVPLLVGASRKSFLAGFADQGAAPAARVPASIAAAALAASLGAHVVRVHDVRACVSAVRLADALRSAAS